MALAAVAQPVLYALFAAGATFQTLAMRKAELGIVYVFVLGLEAVLALLLGALVFRESLNAWKAVGALLVVIGIVLLHQEGGS